MMHLADIPKRAPQRTQGVANQAGPAGQPGVQAADASVAPHAFRDAENGGGRNPIAAGNGGIADRIMPLRSFIVDNAAVHRHSSVNIIQYDASAKDRVAGQGLDGNALSVADGRIHAGSECFERNGRARLEQRGDDFLGRGHGDDGFRMEKV